MKIAKRMAVLALAAATALTFTACGGDSGDGEDGEVKLSYFAWIPEKAMGPIIEEFQKENPEVKIDLSMAQGAATDYARTLTTRIAGNQTPDIYHMSIETRNEIMNGGYALDLTGKPYMEGLDPTGLAMYTRDGKQYGMSLTAWAGNIIYNKDLLAKVGADKVPEDLDGFIELGKKLKEAGITPYMEDLSVVSGSFSPMLGGWYHAQGKSDDEIFEGDKTFSEVWTPLIEEWYKLVKEDVIPANSIGVGQDEIKSQFLNGQLAMYRSGPWDFPDVKQAGINFGNAPYPALTGGEPFIGGGPDSPFVLSSQLEGKKLEAADKFMAFMNSEKGLKMLEELAGQISSSSKYQANVEPEFEDLYKNYLQEGKYYWINWPANGTVMGNTIAAQFQELIQGNATPADVTRVLDEQWQNAS